MSGTQKRSLAAALCLQGPSSTASAVKMSVDSWMSTVIDQSFVPFSALSSVPSSADVSVGLSVSSSLSSFVSSSVSSPVPSSVPSSVPPSVPPSVPSSASVGYAVAQAEDTRGPSLDYATDAFPSSAPHATFPRPHSLQDRGKVGMSSWYTCKLCF